jgi:hypothetical protein
MASPAYTFNNFCYDAALHTRLEQLEGPDHIPVLGLRGAGKRSLLNNLGIIQAGAATAAARGTYPFPAAAAAADARTRNPPADRQRLAINGARLAAFDLGGAQAEARRRRRRLWEYVFDLERRAGAAGMLNPWGQMRGVLFVADVGDWQQLEAARRELFALSEVAELAATPLAVFFNREREQDRWYDAAGEGEVDRAELEGLRKDWYVEHRKPTTHPLSGSDG